MITMNAIKDLEEQVIPGIDNDKKQLQQQQK